MDAAQLRLHVKERMTAGMLPCTNCVVTWYGSGLGRRCAVCDTRILGSDLGIECDLPEGQTIYFHSQCYDVWHAALPV